MAKKKDDPTVSTTAEPAPGTHPAVPVSEGADSADQKQYRELSDDEKPDPTTKAQAEVRPDEQ
jgi:hypothetical protein